MVAFHQIVFEWLNDTVLQDLICWADDGDGFVIKDPKKFEAVVLAPCEHTHSGAIPRAAE